MAKDRPDEVVVVVEMNGADVIGIRSNQANVRVLIADYDVPEDWDGLRVLSAEPDNYFQLFDQKAEVSDVVYDFQKTDAYQPEEID
jgi:hypothetical protein